MAFAPLLPASNCACSVKTSLDFLVSETKLMSNSGCCKTVHYIMCTWKWNHHIKAFSIYCDSSCCFCETSWLHILGINLLIIKAIEHLS